MILSEQSPALYPCSSCLKSQEISNLDYQKDKIHGQLFHLREYLSNMPKTTNLGRNEWKRLGRACTKPHGPGRGTPGTCRSKATKKDDVGEMPEKELTVGVIWVFQFFVPHLLQNPEVGVGVYQPDLEKKCKMLKKCAFLGEKMHKKVQNLRQKAQQSRKCKNVPKNHAKMAPNLGKKIWNYDENLESVLNQKLKSKILGQTQKMREKMPKKCKKKQVNHKKKFAKKQKKYSEKKIKKSVENVQKCEKKHAKRIFPHLLLPGFDLNPHCS